MEEMIQSQSSHKDNGRCGTRYQSQFRCDTTMPSKQRIGTQVWQRKYPQWQINVDATNVIGRVAKSIETLENAFPNNLTAKSTAWRQEKNEVKSDFSETQKSLDEGKYLLLDVVKK